MFFTKKKKKPVEENEEDAFQEQPREPRYSTIARVRVNGFEGEAVLRNINKGGFRMESRTYAAIAVGERHSMKIIPESASNIGVFELEIEVRWIQNTEKSFSSGFLVTRRSADTLFDRYVNYVKTRHTMQAD